MSASSARLRTNLIANICSAAVIFYLPDLNSQSVCGDVSAFHKAQKCSREPPQTIIQVTATQFDNSSNCQPKLPSVRHHCRPLHPMEIQTALECLLLAQSGHFTTEFRCPLLGVKRTWRRPSPRSAFDPKRTSGARFCCDAQRR